ncbi:N-acetyltransferase [Pseudochryseolinea flava]|uniref:N-acetyltransferase n=2 Tax=Pseudochryseolinea flava TaxID=2059302 RepID=A0A364XYQ9_9BACT|nr:N-acetyltransferase [Pseudochryseolinea flava]
MKNFESGEFTYSTDKSLLDVDYIHAFLSQRSYWAKGIPKEVVVRSIENSLSFGVYHHQKQVGFARVVTDYATFGYLADVFIDEGYRGKGLSKSLMEFVFGLEELKGLRRMVLVTSDAHTLYSRHGFKALAVADRFMELHRPNVYSAPVL